MRSTFRIYAFLSLAALNLHAAVTDFSQAGIPANFYRLNGPQAVVSCPTDIIDPNPEAVRIGFYNPPFERVAVDVAGEQFTAIRMEGEAALLEPGSPDLPVVSRLIMVSNTGQIGVRIVSQSYHVEPLDNAPAPVQALLSDQETLDLGPSLPNSDVYNVDTWYPADVAFVSTPATFRDLRIVSLGVCPIQVNPVTREIRVYDQLEVAVENLGGIGENEIEFTPQSLTPDFKKLYNTISNFRGSALDALPVVPGKQLFICIDDPLVTPSVQQLVDWRRKKGIDAYIATTATIGGNDANLIRNYISTQYTASNQTLESVCLVGDPSASAPFNLVTQSTQLDNFFGMMGGGPNPDPVPDIATGRLVATLEAQLANIVSKTINYESNPEVADTTWFKRAWCAAHTGQIQSNPSTKQFTRQIMLQHGMDSVYFSVYGGAIVAGDLIARINQGVCVFNHRMSWLSEMFTGDFTNMDNGGKLPFVMCVTCGTGTFSSGSTQLSEEWLRRGTVADPSGAIGCVGMSGTGTHVAENNMVDAGTMYGIFTLGIRQQGVALVAGKLELFRTYGVHRLSSAENFSYWANLMGDPAVELFTKVPRTSVVTHSATVPINTNNLNVTVTQGGQPLEGALVGLVKGTETFARGYTGSNGVINLPINVPTNGTLNVTVTHERMDTYNGSVTVNTPLASLSFFSNTVDDGNDGILNPGETVNLNLRVRNSGTTNTVTGITGTLTCSLPGITIVNGTQGYPNIAPGANAAPNSPFQIQVGQVFNGEPIAFYLTTASSAGAQVIRMDLTPVSGDVSFVSSSFPDGNNRLDPGDTGAYTVTFNNSGARALTNASAILRSLDSHVSVGDSLGTYGAVAIGANATNGGNSYNVTASVQTVAGYRALMLLVITDVSGFRDSVEFLQTVGLATSNSATGPDNYGYYAYDITETSPPGSAAAYQWTEIRTIGTSLGITDNTQDADQSVVRNLPFTFRYYGNNFTQITVCSNGWLAFGDHANIDDFRNYPIPGPLGPPNMICAFWDDLVIAGITNPGVWSYHDVANGRFIVEWRARTRCSGVDEVFQIVLLDPNVYPSAGGDGKILVQYETVSQSSNCGSAGGVNDNEYATIGIQNADHSDGIQYCYWNDFNPPTATPLTNGSAVVYTTDLTGNLIADLTLIAPNGGESWYTADVRNIDWYPGDTGGNIRIELSRSGAGGPWETITASTPNDGQFAWTVTGPLSAFCRVKITSLVDPLQTDVSLADFSISGMTLNSPNGGELWFTGDVHTISWVPAGVAGTILIELSRNGIGGPWTTLDATSVNDGLFDWTVTAPTSSACRVRITANSNPTETDVSAADFSIGSITVLLEEDFEDGAPDWTHSTPGGQWLDQWHVSTERALSGVSSYKCGDTSTDTYQPLNDARLVSPVLTNLPANASMEFWLQMEAETSAANPDCCYDGSILELSANGGPFVQLFPQAPGYNKTFRYTTNNNPNSPVTGPMPGLACYSGVFTEWRTGTVDLAAYASDDIQVRFRFGSDAAANREGTYVDDVRIYAPVIGPPPPSIPVALTISPASGVLTLRWDDDTNFGYKIYSGATPTGPWDTLEGTSLTNSFTVPGGAATGKRFYYVAGWDGN